MASEAPVHPPCTCGHLDVLHNLSPSSGRRTGCSISDGPKATPCGCKAFIATSVQEETEDHRPEPHPEHLEGDES